MSRDDPELAVTLRPWPADRQHEHPYPRCARVRQTVATSLLCRANTTTPSPSAAACDVRDKRLPRSEASRDVTPSRPNVLLAADYDPSLPDHPARTECGHARELLQTCPPIVSTPKTESPDETLASALLCCPMPGSARF